MLANHSAAPDRPPTPRPVQKAAPREAPETAAAASAPRFEQFPALPGCFSVRQHMYNSAAK
eukprot:8852746-Alexandrium_andersonii.AAC.1